jgi:hypothetical protein
MLFEGCIEIRERGFRWVVEPGETQAKGPHLLNQLSLRV